MKILSIISSYFPSLTKSEQKVAQYVLASPDEVEGLSISELGVNANVAESTVIRFCRKIGFKGFQSFKIELTKSLVENSAKTATPSDNSIENQSLNDYRIVLDETEHFLKESNIKESIRIVNRANRICVVAVGNSGVVGQYLRSRLTRLGKNVVFENDAHLQAIEAALLTENDCVFAISQSGNTNDILKNMQIAKSHNAKIISITNYIKSDVAIGSDISLIASASEGDGSFGNFSAMLGQFYIIDVFCKYLGSMNADNTHRLKMEINRALVDRI